MYNSILKKILRAFEDEREPERMQEALQLLEKTAQSVPPECNTPEEVFAAWLLFFETIERYKDPEWDPDNVPTTGTPPPDTEDGIAYPSHVDPDAIHDPVAKAQYKAMLESDKNDAEYYRMQLLLRRIEGHAVVSLKQWLHTIHERASEELHACEALLSASSLNDSFKQELSAALLPQ
jgi:hypothetical protein